MYHDEEQDIWYECVFDQRKKVYAWTILPPGDCGRGALLRVKGGG